MRDRLGILPRFWAAFLSALLPLVLIAGVLVAAPASFHDEATWKKASGPLQLAAFRLERGEFKFSPNAKTSQLLGLCVGAPARDLVRRRCFRADTAALPRRASGSLAQRRQVGVAELLL